MKKHERQVLRQSKNIQATWRMFLITLKQEMCDDVIRRDLYSLQYVPDWFFTRDWIDM